VRNFGAQYQSGVLNHPTLANQRRALIVRDAYREHRCEVDRGMDVLLQLVDLIGDSDLVRRVKSCVDTLKYQHVRKPILHQNFGTDADSG
jgi:hypothetical protein